MIQTLSGKEEETADMIRKTVSSSCIEECFVSKRERLKKFHGYWNKEDEILFRGYVFTISRRPEELYQQLKHIPRLTKILGREGQYFFSLNQEEQKLIKRIGDEKHKTLISKVKVEVDKQIWVIDGPLKGYERNIVKLNLHKREAVVLVKFMGREIDLKMGIEMVNVRESENRRS